MSLGSNMEREHGVGIVLFPPCPGLSQRGGQGSLSATSCVRLDLLVRLARFLADESDPASALAQMLRWLHRDQGFARGVVSLLNETEDEIVANITAAGIPRATGELMRYRPGEGITGRVIASNAPVYLAGIKPEDGFLDRSGLRQGLALDRLAFYCVPIPYRGKAVGTLSVDRHLDDVTDPAGDLRLLGEIAHLVGPFVQRRRLPDVSGPTCSTASTSSPSTCRRYANAARPTSCCWPMPSP